MQRSSATASLLSNSHLANRACASSSLSRFSICSISLRRFAASLRRANPQSRTEFIEAPNRNVTGTWLGTHHPLAFPRVKKSLRRWPLKGGDIFTQNFAQSVAFSTLPFAILSTRPTWVGAPNPMGVERKPFTVKLDAPNEELVEQIRLAHLPFEVSRSSIVNSLLTIARTQIQVTPASVQQTPRNLSVADLSADGVSGLSDRSASTLAPSATSDSNVAQAREGSVCQELPNSTGAEPRRAVNSSGYISGSSSDQHPGNGGQSNTGPLAIEAAPIPLPQKLRRAERAS